jgi:hypothetical protein
MVKIKVALLLSIFLSVSITSLAQNKTNDDDLAIHFIEASTWTSDKFDVYIEKASSFIKVKYSIFESAPGLAVRNDTGFKALSMKLRSKNLTSGEERKLHEEVTKMLDRHTFFSKDSIVLPVNQYAGYNDLLMRIAKSDKEKLEKNNYSRIMDVGNTTFYVTYNATTKVIDGTVDQSMTNSAIINFVKQTMNLKPGKKLPTVLRIREKYSYYR